MIIVSQSVSDRVFEAVRGCSCLVNRVELKPSLNLAYWTPKVVVLSCAAQDLEALPVLAKQRQFATVLVVEPNQQVWIGKSIDYIVTLDQSARLQAGDQNFQQELNTTSQELTRSLPKFLEPMLKQHYLRSDLIYLIGLSYRLGVPTLTYKLEHDLIGLDQAQVDFELFTVKYGSNQFIVVGLPQSYMTEVRSLARQHNLKLAQGKPLDTSLDQHFPINCSDSQVYVWEYLNHELVPKDRSAYLAQLQAEVQALMPPTPTRMRKK